MTIDRWATRLLFRLHPYLRCRLFRHNLPCQCAGPWCQSGCPRLDWRAVLGGTYATEHSHGPEVDTYATEGTEGE